MWRSARSGSSPGTSRHVTNTANAVMGRLMKNTHSQLSSSVRKPPSSGPTALPSPATPRMSPPASPAFDVGQQRVGHAEDRRPHHRPADAHEAATQDEQLDVRREAAAEREGREDRSADHEDALASEQVGEASAGDDQHAEHERVPVDHPLRVGERRVHVRLDVGDRDAQRGEVVGDHEHAERHREQREPGPRVDPAFRVCHGAQVCHAATPPRRNRPRHRAGRPHLRSQPTAVLSCGCGR